MNLGDYLIWEATNGLLLIPGVIGLVMLARRLRRQPAFTERDWLFLFGHSRKELFSLRLVLRFAALWLLVVIVGLGISFNRILMVIEHENDRYVGCVPFDNYFFCCMILTLLEDCHSRSLREIGELELFYDR